MAQVIRKFATGGQTEVKTPKLFEWAGKQYDVDALKNNVIRERENWLKRNNYSRRERELFDQGFNDLIKAMESEGFGRNPDGSWTNSAGVTSTGQRDSNILGMTKNTSNNAVGIATQLLDHVMNFTPAYKKPESTAPQGKERFNMNIKDAITRKYLGGNWDYGTFEKYDTINPATGKRDYSKRVGYITEALDNYLSQLQSPDFDSKYDLPENFTNKQELIQYLTDAKTQLSNGILDDADYTSLARAGLGGLDELLGITQPQSLSPEQQQAQEIQKKADDKKKWLDQIIANANEKFWRVNVNPNPSGGKTIPGEKLPDTTISNIGNNGGTIKTIPGMVIPASYQDVNDNFEMTGALEKPEDLEAFSRLLQGLNLQDLEAAGYVDDAGNYYIPQLANKEEGTIIRYNPSLKRAERVPLTTFKVGNEILEEMWRSLNASNAWEKMEEGGVLKAQGGSILDDYNRRLASAKQKKEAKPIVERKPDNKPESKSDQPSTRNIGGPTKGTKGSDEWEWDDYTRLGAIGADLAGLIAGFVPGGSVVSAGSGFLSTGANFAADMKDGFQWSDLGNAAVGLGMDVLSVIPGLGVAAKGSKAAKNIIKWAPRLLTAWGAMANTGPAIESLSKLKEKGWSALDVQDWKNIANGIHLIVSGGRGVKRQVQAKNLLNNAKTDMIDVQTSGKPARLSRTQLAELKQKGDLKSQNEYLKSLTKDQKGVGVLETKFGGQWWNPTRNFNNPSTNPVYDFNKKIAVPIINSRGKVTEKQVPLFYTPVEQMIARNAQISTPTFKLPDLKVNAHYNTWKYRDLKTPKKRVTPKKKQGGILVKKMQFGDIMNRNVSPLGNEFLNYENNRKNAYDISKWDSFYNMDKIMSQAGDVFKNKNAGDVTSTLNQLLQESSSWKPEVNARGFTNWNNNFKNAFGDYNRRFFGEDVDRFDYLGPTTWNRRAMLQRMSKMYTKDNPLRTSDGSIYFDGNQFVSTPLSRTTPEITTSQTPELTSTKFRSIEGNNRKGFQLLPEDIIATGRMIGTVMTNNRATRRIKESLRPTLMNTYENYIPQTEDYLGKTSAYNQAATIERQARRIAQGTSDSNLQAAALLEGTSKGNLSRLQGDSLNSQRLFQTGEMGRQESNAAKARRTEVANKNKMAMNAVDMAKGQLDAQNWVNNWMQAVQPWAAGIESRIRNNRAIRKQMDLEGSTYDEQENLARLSRSLNQEVQNGATTQEEAAARLNEYQNQASRRMLERRKNLARGSYMFAPTYASGGKISGKEKALIERARDFNKSVLSTKKEFMKELNNTRKTHADLLKHLSSFTADLIKAGMLWK